MSQAARRAGVDRKLVRRLAGEGRLRRRPDGRFDPEAFAADWAAYEAQKRPKVDGLGTAGARPGPALVSELQEADQLPEDVRRMTYQQARAHRERFAALQAELDYEKAAARLIDRETVKQAWFVEAHRARNLLETMPDRLAPVVVGLADLHAARQAIAAEVRRVCQQISDEAPGIE